MKPTRAISRILFSILLITSVLLASSCSQNSPGNNTVNSATLTDTTVQDQDTGKHFDLNGYTYEGVGNEAELVSVLVLEQNNSGDWVSKMKGKEVPYTGILNNQYGTWYVENGKAVLSKSGSYTDYQGVNWIYTNGKAIKESETTTTTQTTKPSRNTLVYPKESDYVAEHNVEIFSYDLELYTDHINIRYGPSQTDYDVVTRVENGSFAKGLTNSVNGWVFVNVDGTKGWARADLVLHMDGNGELDGIAKPVLYLYPDKKTDVSVKLILKDSAFSCTYPDYGKGWNVTAYPDGKLINKADKKEYSYLYWELDSNMDFDFSKGFIVKGSDTAVFLQKTLSNMGLKPKEYNEFIVYWLPRMQNNEYNLISFQTKTYTDNVKLKISPKPDSVLRVNMAYKALNKKEAQTLKKTIKTQKFPRFERTGFTVVEWGGEEVIKQ